MSTPYTDPGPLVHFVNLTRGLLCEHPATATAGSEPHFSRIQSTHCEQKLWTHVIMGAGPDLLMNLALGNQIIVHDYSEKPRTTRAMWQGLTFVRRACETYWKIPGGDRVPTIGRGGKLMGQYFDQQLKELPKSTVQYVKYYRQFWVGGAPLRIWHCMCWVGDLQDARQQQVLRTRTTLGT